MFGFLASPCRCGVDPGDADTYRGFFCGLANRLHVDYGPLGRFLVNRDATFLSLMTAAQADKEPASELATCCNPLAAKKPRFQEGDHAGYAAAVTICGLTSKIRDEIDDRPALQRPLFRTAEGVTRGWTRRAERFLKERNFPVGPVQESLAGQADLEKCIDAGEVDPESAGQPTRAAFGEIFRHSATVANRPENRDAAGVIGEELGEAIYWLDAVTDFEDDRKRGRFNPLPDDGGKAGFGRRLEKNFHRMRDAFSSLALQRYETTIEAVLLRLTPPKAFAAARIAVPTELSVDFAAASNRKKRHQRSGKVRWWHNCCDGCCPCDDCACDCSCCDSCDCCPCD